MRFISTLRGAIGSVLVSMVLAPEPEARADYLTACQFNKTNVIAGVTNVTPMARVEIKEPIPGTKYTFYTRTKLGHGNNQDYVRVPVSSVTYVSGDGPYCEIPINRNSTFVDVTGER